MYADVVFGISASKKQACNAVKTREIKGIAIQFCRMKNIFRTVKLTEHSTGQIML